jgi:tetratricopeptide (TPR) repeat protein
VDVHNNLGRLYRQAGEITKALDTLQRALALDAGCLATRLELGATLLEARSPKKALIEAESAIELAPEQIAPYLLKSRILQRMKRFQEARATLEQAAQLAPDDERVTALSEELERHQKNSQ